MKTANLITVATFAMLTGCAAHATPPESKAATQSHDMMMSENGGQMQMMRDRVASANTPAERSKLMSENMEMMKAHMSSMKGMMADGHMMSQGEKPMAPMAMHPAQMQKMKQHMDMMHQMMERLMLQQQLMISPKK